MRKINNYKNFIVKSLKTLSNMLITRVTYTATYTYIDCYVSKI